MPSTSTLASEVVMNELHGRYYDGKSSRAYEVTVLLTERVCHITGGGIDRSVPIADLAVAERFEGANRIISFPDGASCELRDSKELAEILHRAGHGDSVVVKAQQRWKWVAASLVLLAIVFGATYQWGFPWIAEKLAYRLPDPILVAISKKTLDSLDRFEMNGIKMVEPSELPEERQQQLRERFAHLSFPPGEYVTTKVQFRASKRFGPNAFALPDGTVVFFDDLVKLAESDEEIVAVFTHEAGHAARRHGMRQMIQGSMTGLVLAAYLGDISSLAGALSGWLIQAKYSRDFERDADRYAATMLRQNNIPPRLLGTFLLRIEKKLGKQSGSEDKKSSLSDYLASHPATQERLQEMEALSH